MDTKSDEGEDRIAGKLERRPRVMRNEAQRAEVIEAHRRSGMTIGAFCRQERIGRSRFTQS